MGVTPPLSVPALRKIAANIATQVTNLYATIDGVPINNLESYRVISPVFQYVLPPNNVAGGSVNLVYFVSAGEVDVTGPVKPAVGDGFYLLLKPLPPGHHTITFGGTTQTLDASGNLATFELDITYHITVTHTP